MYNSKENDTEYMIYKWNITLYIIFLIRLIFKVHLKGNNSAGMYVCSLLDSC